MPPSSSTSGPFSSFPGYGSNNQPGSSSPFNYSGGSGGAGGISTMPWGDQQGGGWNNSNWADQASQYLNFPNGTPEGWGQGPNGMWTMVRDGVTYQQDFAPNSGVGMNIGAIVAGEADQQNQRTQQYLQGLQNVYGPAAQSMFNQAGQVEQVGQDYYQGAMDRANQFMDLANREATPYQEVGNEAVDRFRGVVDNNQNLAAQQASSQSLSMQQATASNIAAQADQMASAGASPEAIAAMKAQVKSASLPDIQAAATNLATQNRQIQNNLEQALAGLETQVDFQNAANRMQHDQFNESMQAQYRASAEALYQNGANAMQQSILMSRQLQDMGNSALAGLVEANYQNGPVSFLSSLMTAANLMYNSPLGTKKDFATRLVGGGVPGLPGAYGATS